jgi:hypothetical protein
MLSEVVHRNVTGRQPQVLTDGATISYSSTYKTTRSVGMNIVTAFLLRADFPISFLLLFAFAVALATLILFYLFTLRR